MDRRRTREFKLDGKGNEEREVTEIKGLPKREEKKKKKTLTGKEEMARERTQLMGSCGQSTEAGFPRRG